MNEWNKLCEECLKIVEESKMTNEEIDNIARECRRLLN